MAVFAPDVTGVGNALPFPTLFDFERADGRTEHVTGVGESEIDIIAYSEAPVVTDGQEMLHHTIHLMCVVERFDGRFVKFSHLFVVPPYILRQNICRVGKHDGTKVSGGGSGDDIAPEAEFVDVRE